MEYGKRCTEKQTYIDIETVYEYCLESKLVSDPSKEIILYGQSVGSDPSCFLAPRKPIAGIIFVFFEDVWGRLQLLTGICDCVVGRPFALIFAITCVLCSASPVLLSCSHVKCLIFFL